MGQSLSSQSLLWFRISLSFYFIFLGCIIGTWSSLMSVIKIDHNLSDATLGAVLLSAIGGGILASPIAAYCNTQFGSSKNMLLGSLISLSIFPLLGVTYNDNPQLDIAVLIISIACLGVGMIWCDVSMNTLSSSFEKLSRKHYMGYFQSLYAVGAVVGVLLGGLLLEKGCSAFQILCLNTMVLTPLVIAFYFWLFTKEEQEGGSNDDDNNLETSILISKEVGISQKVDRRQVCCLMLLGFLAYQGEGMVGDWGVIYMTSTLKAPPLFATLGFAAFQCFVIFGRLGSDYLHKYWKTSFILKVSGFVSSCGMSIVIYAPSSPWPLSICVSGFAVMGLGLSFVAPLVISAAGK